MVKGEDRGESLCRESATAKPAFVSSRRLDCSERGFTVEKEYPTRGANAKRDGSLLAWWAFRKTGPRPHGRPTVVTIFTVHRRETGRPALAVYHSSFFY